MKGLSGCDRLIKISAGIKDGAMPDGSEISMMLIHKFAMVNGWR